MTSKLTRALTLAALMASAGSVGVANATDGWYGRADVGISIDGELDGDVADGNTTADFGPDLEDGWIGDIGAGYGFGNGFRVEGELSYRNNQFDAIDVADPIDGTVAGGSVNTWALMGNLLYDFNSNGRFQPYLGVGAGAARPRVKIDGGGSATDTVFAYQGLAGLGIALSDRTTLDIGYRYFVAPDVDISEAWGTGFTSEVDYQHQAVTVGLRWQFGAAAAPPPPPPPAYVPPPPPPPPVAAACPTSEFVVYFEWDRSNLNQAALETIDAAVNRARQCNVSGTVVVGHTDTSGSPTYNQGLSERRASVVRDALTARGLPGTIQTQARGETDLARATRDGVREPLNRRSAVTISFR